MYYKKVKSIFIAIVIKIFWLTKIVIYITIKLSFKGVIFIKIKLGFIFIYKFLLQVPFFLC